MSFRQLIAAPVIIALTAVVRGIGLLDHLQLILGGDE